MILSSPRIDIFATMLLQWFVNTTYRVLSSVLSLSPLCCEPSIASQLNSYILVTEQRVSSYSPRVSPFITSLNLANMATKGSPFTKAVKEAFHCSHLGDQFISECDQNIKLGSAQLSSRLRQPTYEEQTSSLPPAGRQRSFTNQFLRSRPSHTQSDAVEQRTRSATHLDSTHDFQIPGRLSPGSSIGSDDTTSTVRYTKSSAKPVRVIRPRGPSRLPFPQLGLLTQHSGVPISSEMRDGYPICLEELYVQMGIFSQATYMYSSLTKINAVIQGFVCSNGMSAIYIMLLANRRKLQAAKPGTLRLDDVVKPKHSEPASKPVAPPAEKLAATAGLPLVVKELYCEVSGAEMDDVNEKTMKKWKQRWPVSDHHLQRVIEGNLEEVQPVKLFDQRLLRRCTELTVEQVLSLPKDWEHKAKKTGVRMLRGQSFFEKW